MNTFRSNVPTLEGNNNFSIWEIQIKTYLQGLELWGKVDTSVKFPVTGSDEDKAKWNMFDTQAKAAIFQTLQPDEIMQVADKVLSKDVFNHLKQVYSASSELMKLMTQNSYHSFQLRINEPPVASFARLTAITRSLEALGQKTADTDFIAKFLSTLPFDEYSSFRLFWSALDDTKQTKSTLLSQLQILNTAEEPATAFWTDNNNGNDGGRRNGRFNGNNREGGGAYHQGSNRGGGGGGNGQRFNRSGGGGGGNDQGSNQNEDRPMGNQDGKRWHNCNSTEHLARNCNKPKQDNNGGGDNINGNWNNNSDNKWNHNDREGDGNGNSNWNRGRGRGKGNWRHKSANTRAFHADAES